MTQGLQDRGKFLSMELIGYHHVDQVVDHYGEKLTFDGLMVGLAIGNHSDEHCRWAPESLEVIDVEGFAYSIGDDMATSMFSELLPGGWHAGYSLDSVNPNRKYRYAVYLKDFHSEPQMITFEAQLSMLVDPTDVDMMQEWERLEIDLSQAPNAATNVPELKEAFSH